MSQTISPNSHSINGSLIDMTGNIASKENNIANRRRRFPSKLMLDLEIMAADEENHNKQEPSSLQISAAGGRSESSGSSIGPGVISANPQPKLSAYDAPSSFRDTRQSEVRDEITPDDHFRNPPRQIEIGFSYQKDPSMMDSHGIELSQVHFNPEQIEEVKADPGDVDEPSPFVRHEFPSPIGKNTPSEGPKPESKGSDPISLPKASSEVSLNDKQLNLKQQELVLMRPWVLAWFFICAFFDMASLADISLWTRFEGTTLVLQYTQTMFIGFCSWKAYWEGKLEFTKWGLFSMNYRFITVLCTQWSQALRIVPDPENIEDFTSVSLIVARINFLLLCLFFNSLFVIKILDNRQYTMYLLVMTLIPAITFSSEAFRVMGLMKEVLLFSQFVGLDFILATICVLTFRITHQYNQLQNTYLISQRQESDQYKRMIDSIEEAMFVYQGSKINFRNAMAQTLFKDTFASEEIQEHQEQSPSHGHGNESEEELNSWLDKKIFYLFKDLRGDQEKEDPMGTTSVKKSQAAKSSTSTALSQEAFSVRDLVSQRRSATLSSSVFTLNKDFAKCTSMNHMQEIIAAIAEQKADQKQFNFFLIKSFKLHRRLLEQTSEPEIAVQLVDISQKILSDTLSTERKYMSYMNSTISHEMRNPLNSIASQLAVINSMVQDVKSLREDFNDRLTHRERQELDEFDKQCEHSIAICLSSCKLLTFNVEDILALPQLKDQRFTKNIQHINIGQSVVDVMKIQELQAKEKKVQLKHTVHGFPTLGGSALKAGGRKPSLPLTSLREEAFNTRVFMDEKRFQQVLLNYQSNALKFLNKQKGKIQILLQFVPKHQEEEEEKHFESDPFEEEGDYSDSVKFFRRQIEAFFGFNLIDRQLGLDTSQNSDRGEALPCEEPSGPYSLFTPGETDKLVLSVLDNGIGIKNVDKSKLFKLFGCLKSTRSMNTQGIGLGLVITKMLTEEFGGNTKMFSLYNIGSIFQSSFEIIPQAEIKQVPSDQFRQQIKSSLSLSQMKESDFQTVDYSQKILIARQNQARKCLENYQLIRDDRLGFEFNKKKILIIDDESFNCQAVLGMLKILKLPDLKQQVDFAYSGEEALQLLKENIQDANTPMVYSKLNKSGEESEAVEDSLDLSLPRPKSRTFSKKNSTRPKLRPIGGLVCNYGVIFTDCSMPFMDGYECCRRMNSILDSFGLTDYSERPRILALTGHVESEYQRRAILSGMEQIYSKPVRISTVASILLENGFDIKLPKDVENDLIQKLEEEQK